MPWGFLSAFVEAGGREATQKLTDAIVTAAPETSIHAQQIQDSKDLDAAGQIIIRYRHDLDEAQRHFDESNQRYHQQVGAAEVLDTRIKEIDARLADPNIPDDQKAVLSNEKASKTASLNSLVTKLETLVHEVDHTRDQLAMVQQDLKNAEDAYQQQAGNLVQSKEKLEEARRDMERANLESQRASQRQKDAEVIAGLSKTSNIGTAVDSMARAAQQARDKAAAANLKADALKQHSHHDEDDPNIVAAMAQASGAVTEQSLGDRLAALRQRAA